ncbi:MAG: phenylalanine--tRNA ligase subunit beta [Myxococcales bacterium]|nr:phenylalanine--tRNA ligase subunit beta [Myxococcales bacterium]
MRVSLSWLAEYASLPGSPEALAHKLTMAGLEVEGIERLGEELAGVVVAEVKESARHPNADRLTVNRVDAGAGPVQIVCGASNFKVGDKVSLANPGTKLPSGAEIKVASVRGVESFGMLCSAKELGLSDDASGLLILDAAAKPGTPLARALGLDDVILEINVTPNRPDALCHLGIAREVAVLTGQALRPPAIRPAEGGGRAADRVRIRIDDAARCPRYVGRVIEGVSVKPGPAWMAARLQACGVRSINNVVDVTNYVLLEYGQPLHAFDLDRVAGAEIVVRTARPGERLTTLDGKERALDADDLLVCDRDHGQVLAGVMGGADSEVSSSTRRILLECAHFLPATVRRSSKRHGLHTESSHRFERGTDVNAIPEVIDRAAALIAETGKGTVLEGRVDAYPTPVASRRVSLRHGRAGAVLGAPVPAEESRRILIALGFTPELESPDATSWAVPTRRVDVEREEDLIEEIARIRGYDAIPSSMPSGAADLKAEPVERECERRIRAALAGSGFDEVVNYSFVAPAELAAFAERPEAIALQNPLSVEQSVMRTTLYAGLLRNVSRNLRHQSELLRLYEIGRVYLRDPEGGAGLRPVAMEVLEVAGALYGRRARRSWTAKDEAADFFDAKGAVEAVLSALNVRATFAVADSPAYHPRAAAEVRCESGGRLGSLGELHPRVAKRLDVPAGIYLFQLEVEALVRAAEPVPAYRPIGRFPAVLRDIAVVVPLELRNEEVKSVILEVGAPLVEDAVVFDVYSGKPLPEGRKNLAYALRYRAADRTLTDSEVSDAHQRIIQEVNRRLGAHLRGAG